jgi:hypothetical protein
MANRSWLASSRRSIERLTPGARCGIMTTKGYSAVDHAPTVASDGD